MTSNYSNYYGITSQGSSRLHAGDNNYYYYTTPQDPRLSFTNYQSSEGLELHTDHIQARDLHSTTTGNWFLQSSQFLSWLDKPKSLIWLHGIAGCGKTVLSSTIIEHLRSSARENSRTISYYFNAGQDEKRTFSRLLQFLLVQLCQSQEELPSKVVSLLKKRDRHEFSDDNDTLEALQELLQGEGHTYIIIDALDECDATYRSTKKPEAEKIAKFIEWLVNLRGCKLHILVTSRDGGLAKPIEVVLDRESQRGENMGQYNIDLHDCKDRINHDIRLFAASTIQKWHDWGGRKWLPLNQHRQKYVIDSVEKKANGMFQLAKCLLDLIHERATWNETDGTLEDLPQDLSKVYDEIMSKIESQNRMPEALVLIRWLLHSKRPLSISELSEILLFDCQDASVDLNNAAEDVAYAQHILSSLITKSRDNLVQFAHQTVRQYLVLRTTQEGLFFRPAEGHTFITKCCLSYIQYSARPGFNCNPVDRSREHLSRRHPLSEYVLFHWHVHFLEALEANSRASRIEVFQAPPMPRQDEGDPLIGPGGGPEISQPFDVALLSETDSWPSRNWAASMLLLFDQWLVANHVPGNNSFQALIDQASAKFLSFFGAFQDGQNVDHVDQALHSALVVGIDEVVRLLIFGETSRPRNGSDMDTIQRQNPAPTKAREEVVLLLIDHGANVELADFEGWTPLHIAASQGHQAILQGCLKSCENIDVSDCFGITALHVASSKGHAIATRILLDQGALITAKDHFGRTALDFAVQEAVLILSRSEKLIRHGSTLPAALERECEAVVQTIELLLERDCFSQSGSDPDVVENHNMRALNHYFGQRELAHFFNTDGKSMDSDSDMLMMRATVRSVTQFNTVNHYNGPLLSYWGFVTDGRIIVPSLMEVFLYARPICVLTSPLVVGTAGMSKWSLKPCTMLLKSMITSGELITFNTGADVQSITINGGTNTFNAMIQIRTAVVNGGGVTFNAIANVHTLVINGGSAIFCGVANVGTIVVNGGHAIFHGIVNVESIVVNGGLAIFCGFSDVQMIVVNGGLITSLGNGLVSIGELVLNDGTVNFWSPIRIQNLRSRGYDVGFLHQLFKQIMGLLVEGTTVMGGESCLNGEPSSSSRLPRLRGKKHRISESALSVAISNQQYALAALLLRKGADPNAKPSGNDSIRMPLHEAAFQGHTRMVQLLLEEKADIHVRDSDGRTASQVASSQGHTAIAQLLEPGGLFTRDTP